MRKTIRGAFVVASSPTMTGWVLEISRNCTACKKELEVLQVLCNVAGTLGFWELSFFGGFRVLRFSAVDSPVPYMS